MITSRIKIGDDAIQDFQEAWGFVYLDADERFDAPLKKCATSSYAEQPGENSDNKTVADAFDYTAKFCIDAPNRDLTRVNAVIARFNNALYFKDPDSDVRTYRQVEFYNDLNHVKIVGVPDPVQEAKSCWRSPRLGLMECAVVELKIRVRNPGLCDFNLKSE